MTSDQRTKLMAYWWPDAARAQGWDPNSRQLRLHHLSQAVGRQLQSATELNTTTDIDAVKSYLLALSQPANVTSQVEIANMPRTRLITSIESFMDSRPGYGFHPNYIAAISRNMYGTADWKSLPDHQLTNLRNTVSNRARAKKKQVALVPEPAPADDNLPF